MTPLILKTRSAILVTLLFVGGSALATPRPLPFSYPYETLGKGQLEIEQYADYIPQVQNYGGDKNRPYGAIQFQTEFEYGITDRLELGLYVTYAIAEPLQYTEPPSFFDGTAIKQRLRYRLVDPGEWPVDVAVYGEATESQTEFELEAKVILQRRFGKLTAMVNLWAEHEWSFASGEQIWVINPTAGLTYQITPTFRPGVEAWMREEWPLPAPAAHEFNQGPAVYVGPAMMFNFGKLWWTLGAYARVTETNHVMVPGDQFGKFWVRSVIGVDFY